MKETIFSGSSRVLFLKTRAFKEEAQPKTPPLSVEKIK
jgi:hypothetical protein